MLWFFLILFNILFILILWDYCKTNFYNCFTSYNIFPTHLLFTNLQYFYYYSYLQTVVDLKCLFLKYLKFIAFFLTKGANISLWLKCNLWLQTYIYFNVVIFAYLYLNIYTLVLNFIYLFTKVPFINITNPVYNWEGVFQHYNLYSVTTNLNYLTSLQHLFILLTIFLTPFALFSNWNDLKYKIFNIKAFLIILTSLILLLVISFSTLNLFLFIIMFEATTLPLFLLISLFGHRSKKYRAAWYLFIYTLVGSIFMLGSVILIYYQYKTLNLFEIFFNYQFTNISLERFKLIWIGLFIGFAIKVPIAPFHMWLPEAHVEAPTAGSILLAGILLKLGGYGIIFFMLPFFNNNFFLPLVYTLTIISMFYSSFILFRETHLKKIIAYSSIVHMNIGILGLFSNSLIGIMGGIFMMFSHGFISAGLFYSAGIIFNRFKSYDITTIKNLSSNMPKFSFFVILLIFGNMGLPLTSGFIGEFLVLFGTAQHNYFITFSLLIVLLLNTIYNIILLTRILYGNLLWPAFFNNKILKKKTITKPKWMLLTITQDISRLDFFALGSLGFYSIFFGIFPNFLISGLISDGYLQFI